MVLPALFQRGRPNLSPWSCVQEGKLPCWLSCCICPLDPQACLHQDSQVRHTNRYDSDSCSSSHLRDGTRASGKCRHERASFLSLPLGLIVASALVDVSQQKLSDFKDKSQSLKSRKALPLAHQGTCVWAAAPPSTGSFSPPSERRWRLFSIRLLRLKSSPILAHLPKVGWRGWLLQSRLSRRQVTSPQLRPRSPRCHGADLCTDLQPATLHLSVRSHPNPWRQRKSVPSSFVG